MFNYHSRFPKSPADNVHKVTEFRRCFDREFSGGNYVFFRVTLVGPYYFPGTQDFGLVPEHRAAESNYTHPYHENTSI